MFDRLRGRADLTPSERGSLYTIQESGNASHTELAELRRLIGANPFLPAAPASSGDGAEGSGAEGGSVLDAFEEHPDANGRHLRALLAAGVRPERLARALSLLEGQEIQSLDEARREVDVLRQDLPDLFDGVAQPGPPRRSLPNSLPSGGPPRSRQRGESAKDAARREAEKRGWVKPPNDAA